METFPESGRRSATHNGVDQSRSYGPAAAMQAPIAWADLVRASFDSKTAEWWEERVGIYETDAGVPRWCAEVHAVEDTGGHRPVQNAAG
jgi:hypothetical protein